MIDYYELKIFKSYKEDSLQYKILSAYLKYFDGNKDKLNLLLKDKMSAKGNPLFIQISKNMENLVGEDNKVSNQTLWKFFYQKDYSPSATKIKDIENYIQTVKKVLEIRKLKVGVITKFSEIHKDDQYSKLHQNPNTSFIVQLVKDLQVAVKEKKIINSLNSDIPKLFLENYKEHEISQNTIKIITDFLVVNSEEEIKDEKFENDKEWYYGITRVFDIIILLLFLFFINYNSTNSVNEDEVILSFEEQQKIEPDCVFENDSTDVYKILIVPFESRYSIGGIGIGEVIEERLDKLNNVDNLNISVHYCYDFIYDKNSGDGNEQEYYTRVMNMYNADHIIYGSTRNMVAEEFTNLTELRVNYCTKASNRLTEYTQYDDHEEYDYVSLSELSDGALLGNIEYVIYMNIAVALFNEMKYENALWYLNSISDVGEGHFDYTRLKAWVYANMKNYAKALLSAEDLLNMDLAPIDVAFSYSLRGKIKMQLGDYTSLEDFKKSLSINPNNSDTYDKISKYHWYINRDYKRAISNINLAINVAENDYYKALWYHNKSIIEYQNGLYSESLESINIAIELNNNQEHYQVDRAIKLLALNRDLEAIGAMHEYIRLKGGEDIFSSLNLARIYMKMNNPDTALKYYDKVLFVDPCQKEALDAKLYYLYQNKNYNLIKVLTDNCLKLNSKIYPVLYYKYNILMLENSITEAAELFGFMDEISPTVYFNFNTENQLININPLYDSLSNNSKQHYKLVIDNGDTLSKTKYIFFE